MRTEVEFFLAVHVDSDVGVLTNAGVKSLRDRIKALIEADGGEMQVGVPFQPKIVVDEIRTELIFKYGP